MNTMELAREPAAEGYWACVTTPARRGIVRECLAAFERHHVALRGLSLFRDEQRRGHTIVSVESASLDGVETALAEIAGDGASAG